MKKAIYLLLVAVLLVAVSCEDVATEVADKGVVDVSMEVSSPKAISMTVDDGVTRYQYRALPQFDLAGEDYNEGIFGEQRVWRDITIVDMKASLGYYRQGLWIFQLRTLNDNGQVLATGQSDPVYLQKGHRNVVRIVLKTDDGEGRPGQNENTGKVRFGFETNLLDLSDVDLSKACIKIEADKLDTTGNVKTKDCGMNLKDPGFSKLLPGKADSGWMVAEFGFDSVVGEGRARYYAETPDLVETDRDGVKVFTGGIVAGQYIVRIKLCVSDETQAGGSDIVVAGQQLAVKVVGGETTTVVGTLVPERYVEGGLALNIAPDVDGEIQTDGSFEVTTDDLSTAAVVLKYVPDGTLEGELSYQWYVDGGSVANADKSSFEFHPTQYGDAKITCHVYGYIGGSFGKQASATQVVRVMPESGANINE